MLSPGGCETTPGSCENTAGSCATSASEPLTSPGGRATSASGRFSTPGVGARRLRDLRVQNLELVARPDLLMLVWTTANIYICHVLIWKRLHSREQMVITAGMPMDRRVGVLRALLTTGSPALHVLSTGSSSWVA